jgi:type I restriction enzyme, S subunit
LSGFEHVGEIAVMNVVAPPRGWTESSLGKIARIERTTIQPEAIQTGTVYLGLEHITSEGYFTEIEAVEAGELASNKFAFSDKHLLYGKLRPYLKKIARPQFSGICSTDILPILPNAEVDRDFLYHYLRQPSFIELATTRSTGANLPRLSPKDLADFPVLFPPIAEQRRIAAILDRADAVRRKRQAAIGLTEELLRSTFLEMFGDPVANPKGWDVVELQNVCRRITDGTHQPPDWATEGIPFLFVSNIVNGEIDFNVSKYITEETWRSLNSRCPIELNDILYTTVGSYGNAALVRTEKRFSFQRHIAHIKPDSSKIHPEFLVGLMQSDGIKRQADQQVRGIAQKTLNLRELKEFKVLVPPSEEQNKYVSLQRTMEKCLRNQRNAFVDENNLFNSLLQRAFRGEL